MHHSIIDRYRCICIDAEIAMFHLQFSSTIVEPIVKATIAVESVESSEELKTIGNVASRNNPDSTDTTDNLRTMRHLRCIHKPRQTAIAIYQRIFPYDHTLEREIIHLPLT